MKCIICSATINDDACALIYDIEGGDRKVFSCDTCNDNGSFDTWIDCFSRVLPHTVERKRRGMKATHKVTWTENDGTKHKVTGGYKACHALYEVLKPLIGSRLKQAAQAKI